jgi:sulfate permease, SulP family
MSRTFHDRLVAEFQPGRLFPSIIAGSIAGILTIMIEISLASLIFSGDLSRFVSNGIGISLFGSFVIGIVVALTSSLCGAVGVAQDIPAAILAPMVAGIVSSLSSSASPEATYATVVAAIAITSLVTGIGFLLMGIFHLGGVIRFIPYPVIGGFLAGTGWILIKGSFSVMASASLTLAGLSHLFRADILHRWLPGLVLAILLYVVARRYKHFLIIPGLLLTAIVTFYAVIWVMGASMSYVGERGWLLGPFPRGALWHPVSLAGLRLVDWQAIFGNAGGIATILLVSAVSLLLNASGLELTVRQDIDLERELRSTGLANLLSGLGGGTPGFMALSLSTLGYRLKADSRLVGIFSACLCGVTLFFGAPLLSFLPKQVIGGLLLFLGLSFLVEWVFDSWFKMSKRDCVIIILILVTMNTFGVLQGVSLGILVAVGLFVFDYSRTSVIRHDLSGTCFRSNVDRPEFFEKYLYEHGELTWILELQSFIFFGTASKLLNHVRRRMDEAERPHPRYVLLDFHHVTGLDSSVVLSFIKIKQLAHAYDFMLVLTHLSSAMLKRLEKEVLTQSDAALWRIFSDINHGVAWCEEQIIQDGVQSNMNLKTIFQRVEPVLPGADGAQRLQAYCEQIEVQSGQVLIRQGQPPGGLFFIESGSVEAELELNNGGHLGLRKMSGTIVGEMSLYTGHPAAASVVVDQPGKVYFLSAEKLREMEMNAPDLAAALHKYIARLLSDRLTYSNHVVEALLE